ncbi:MAG: SRPBCC family protein [Thermoanaerobaculia bacterium]|nr:SRPBCC family protein [Thermoanaerobaculia bacterium]
MSAPPAEYPPPPRLRSGRAPLRFFLVTATVTLLLAIAGEWNLFGYFLVFGLPFTGGFALGWSLDCDRRLLLVLVGVVIVVVGASALIFGWAGIVCTAILATVLILPMAIGAILGRSMERRLQRRYGAAPSAVPVILFAVVAAGMTAEAALTPPFEPESVSTRRVLPVTPSEAWDRILFYEEVPFDPPLLARIGVPHPVRTEGRVTGVGDVKRCIYTTGHLRKRITRYRRDEELVFDVIEQRGIEDRSAELLAGSFRFEELPDGSTAVILTTTYRPLLQARPVWRPFERAVAHALHGHVLDGMERREPAPPHLLTAVTAAP